MFDRVLNMSIVGGYCILLAMVLRLLFVKCDRKYVYYLWLAVFLNLILPFAPQGDYSLIPRRVAEVSVEQAHDFGTLQKADFTAKLPKAGTDAEEKKAYAPTGDERENGITKSVMPERDITDGEKISAGKKAAAEPAAAGDDVSFTFGQIFQIAWFCGLFLLMFVTLLQAFRVKRMISRKRWASWDEKMRVAEVKGLAAPFLWGVFCPIIFLPTGLDVKEKKYVIAHESFHRKRKDSVLKIVVFAIVSIHWFNPLVWAAWILFCRDMEVSCDEAVLAGAKADIKKEYAQSLLKYAALQSGYLMTPVTFGEPSVKVRIKNVLKYKKKNVVWTIAAAFAVLAIALGITVHPREMSEKLTNLIPVPAKNLTKPEITYYTQNGDNGAKAGVYRSVGENGTGKLLLAGDYEILGEDAASLYVGREEEGYLYIDSIQKVDGSVKSDLMERGDWVFGNKFFSFYVNEDYIVYAAGLKKNGHAPDPHWSDFYSYNKKTGDLNTITSSLDVQFYVMHDYIFFEKYGEEAYRSDVIDCGIYRTDPAFSQEVQVGENLSLLSCDKEGESLFAWKRVDETTGNQVVRIDWDGKNERKLFDTEDLGWEKEAYDTISFGEPKVQENCIVLDVEQWGYRGEDAFKDSFIRSAQIQIQTDGSGFEVLSEKNGKSGKAADRMQTEANLAAPRNQVYIQVLTELLENGILPDGEKAIDDYTPYFTIYDIDADGKDELLLENFAGGHAFQGYMVYAYREETGKFEKKLEGTLDTVFYDNGNVTVGANNNHTFGDLWPYALYQYNRASDEYVWIASAKNWKSELNMEDLDGNPFPTEADLDGDGTVYCITTEEGREYMDLDGYDQWYDRYLGGAKRIELTFLRLSEEQIIKFFSFY